MKDLVIFGTGGFAREVHQIVEDLNREATPWNFIGFLDGNRAMHGQQVHSFPVLGGADWLIEHPETHVVVAVGSTPVRRRITLQMAANGHKNFATLIHPLAWVGNRVDIGVGTVICAGAMVTTDIKVGNHVILNLEVTVGHDTVLEDFVTVAPSANISGTVHISEGCDLGTNSTIIQGLEIGHWTILGAGAVVSKSLPPNVTAVGIPAKPIKERPEGWHL